MKNCLSIKKIIVPIVIGLHVLTLGAQEADFRLYSTSIGVGILGSSSENATGGISIALDLTTRLQNHLFSAYLNGSSELSIYDAQENYLEADLTYGRVFKFSNLIELEGHAGAGYFRYNYKNGSTQFKQDSESTIGFPIRVKLIFYPAKHFGIAVNPNVNINSLVNTFSGNISFQYRF